MSVIPRTGYSGWYLALSTGENNRLYIDIPPQRVFCYLAKIFSHCEIRRSLGKIILGQCGTDRQSFLKVQSR